MFGKLEVHVLEVVWRFEPITFYIRELRVKLILAPHAICYHSLISHLYLSGIAQGLLLWLDTKRHVIQWDWILCSNMDTILGPMIKSAYKPFNQIEY